MGDMYEVQRELTFNENILGIIKNDILVVMGNDNGYRAILRFWDRLALNAWLYLSSIEVINEGANRLSGDFFSLLIWELLVLDGILDSESWPLANFQVEIAGMLSEGLSINSGEVDL
jgi:hypothetical protein